ncbi:synaptotagmin-5 [Anabrus simplex]|uniref:synaptotagmin-5 n=1 Tax=Anabrus simplex TaxID=316456 RepID=UPI0035A3C3EA
MTLELGIWGKFMVMAVGASIVLVVLLIVVCFLGPGCCIYECVHAEEERERRRRRLAAAVGSVKVEKKGEDFKLTTLQRESSLYDSVGSANSLLGRMDHRDSTYSSMSEATERSSSFRSVCTVDSGDSVVDGKPNKSGPPILSMSLQYLAAEENGSGKLVIGIKSILRLPPKDYVGSLEPFVLLEVIRTTWPLHRRAGTPLHQLRTRALRHSYNPHFQQAFVIDARRSEIRDWCLRVAAFDQDRFGNPTELCHLDVALKDVKGLTRGLESHLTYSLQPSNREMGELLLGLSYLPTAQRLTVSVIRAARLKFLSVAESATEFNPFVRVIHLHGSTGRSVKRKKTAVRPGSDAPEFNETLTFDLTATQLESAVFLVLLCSRAASSKNRDRCLGKVALGQLVGVKRARDHWLSVMQSPRSVHSAWHILK